MAEYLSQDEIDSLLGIAEDNEEPIIREGGDSIRLSSDTDIVTIELRGNMNDILNSELIKELMILSFRSGLVNQFSIK